MSHDTLYLESQAVKANRPQRKSTRGGKKTRSMAVTAVQKKKPPKARIAVK